MYLKTKKYGPAIATTICILLFSAHITIADEIDSSKQLDAYSYMINADQNNRKGLPVQALEYYEKAAALYSSILRTGSEDISKLIVERLQYCESQIKELQDKLLLNDPVTLGDSNAMSEITQTPQSTTGINSDNLLEDIEQSYKYSDTESDLHKQLAQTHDRLREVQAQNLELQEVYLELEVLKSEKDDLQQRLEIIANQRDELAKGVETGSYEVMECRQENELLNDKIREITLNQDGMAFTLQKAQQTSEELEREIAQKETMLLDIMDNNTKLEQQITSSENAVSMLKEKESEVAILDQSLTTLRTEMKQLQEQNKNLQQQKTELEHEKASMIKEVAEYHKLDEELKREKFIRDQIETTLVKLEAETEQVRATLESMRDLNLEMQNRLKAKNALLDKAQKEKAALNQKLTTVIANKNLLEQESKQVAEDHEELRKNYVSRLTEFQKATENSQELERKIKTQNAEIKKYAAIKERVIKLQTDLKQLAGTLRNVGELRHQRKQAEKKVVIMQENINKMQQDFKRNNEELILMAKNQKILRDTNNNLRKEKSALNNQIAMLNKNDNNLQQKLETLTKARNELLQTNRKLQQENAKIQTQLQEANTIRKKMQNLTARLHEANNQLENVETIKKRSEMLKTRVKVLELENKSLQANLQGEKNKREQLFTQYLNLREKQKSPPKDKTPEKTIKTKYQEKERKAFTSEKPQKIQTQTPPPAETVETPVISDPDEIDADLEKRINMLNSRMESLLGELDELEE